MIRFGGSTLTLTLSLLLLPAVAVAQKPKDTKQTKEAAKYVGLAMTRTDDASKQEMYQKGLEALKDALQKDADNPKVWYVAGQIQVGLHHYAAADSAFTKAEQLYPDYAQELESEREAGWIDAFTEGVDLMDRQQNDSALAVFQAGQKLYPKRPEALLNIGSIYYSKNEMDKAEDAFRQVIAIVNQPKPAGLSEQDAKKWQGYAEMAQSNIAQMKGAEGVHAFSADDFVKAAQDFRDAIKINPYSRDFQFNLAQSLYARARDLEAKKDSVSPEEKSSINQELGQIYPELRTVVQQVREFDPNNEDMLLILAQTERRAGELPGDSASRVAGQRAALKVLQEHDALPVGISNLQIVPADSTATVNGVVTNRKLTAGAPVTVKIMLLGRDGAVVGQGEVTANVAEPEKPADFSLDIKTTGSVAGWKYEVSS